MKFTDAMNDLMERVQELLQEEQYSDFMLERLYRMNEDIIQPAVRALQARPKHAHSAETLQSLFRAVEEYVVTFQQSTPERREKRRHKVEGLKSQVRRELLPSSDREGQVEQLMDDIRKWQWKTNLDAQGRLVYTTASGAVVPARGLIAEKVGPQVIAQAVKAQQPYADKTRPRDVRGEPGGLILIEEGERAICVGDLHGRYDNLEIILKDKNNLRDILSGRAHLIFVGDAVHPSSVAMNSPEAYEDSFCVMLLIMTLKAENPFNIHYLIGNHDNAHVGGMPAGRGQIRQDEQFKSFIIQRFGQETFDRYCEFVMTSPIAAKVKLPNGSILLVHACLSPRVLSEQGLINIFVKGRQNKALQELLWSRDYNLEFIRKGLESVGATFVISGHTNPTVRRAEKYGFSVIAESVAAHVADKQLILSAQGNVFGYVDVDMTTPLPRKVTELTTRDGKPSFRVLRPKPGARPGVAAAPEAPLEAEIVEPAQVSQEPAEAEAVDEDYDEEGPLEAEAVE